MKNILFSLLLVVGITFPASAGTDIQSAYHRSYSYEKVQDYKNAIKALAPVYRDFPDGYTVNLRLGWLYYLSGSYANAKENYDKALKVSQYSVDARLGLTLVLMAQQKWNDAEKVIYEVLKTDYYSYYGNLRLSYVLRQQAKYELAGKVVLKMLDLYPTNVPYLEELAAIYVATGETASATSLYTDILVLDPENVAANAWFGAKTK